MSIRAAALAAILAIGVTLAGTAIGQSGAPATAQQSSTAATADVMTLAQAAVRRSHRFRGKVTSTHRREGWFRMRTTTRRSVRIHTNRHTDWDDCDWGDMHRGHRIAVRAHRSHGRWIASRMRNWGDDDHDADDHDDRHDNDRHDNPTMR